MKVYCCVYVKSQSMHLISDTLQLFANLSLVDGELLFGGLSFPSLEAGLLHDSEFGRCFLE